MKRPLPAPSTVSRSKPPKRPAIAPPPRRAAQPPLPRRTLPRQPALRPPPQKLARREIARIIDDSDTSLVDVLDSLLNQGVVLRADLVLALADVDLVYVQLSALLCAADRVLPPEDG